MPETLFQQRLQLSTLVSPPMLQLQLYLGLQVFRAEWSARSARGI